MAGSGLGPGAVVRTDTVERTVGRAPDAPYDVVFADPPYAVADRDLSAVLTSAVRGGWLAPAAVVAVERATRGGAWTWPAGVLAVRSRRYGEATLWYGRAAGAEPATEPLVAETGPTGER